MRTVLLALALAALTTACRSYRASPLDETAVFDDLRRMSLDSLGLAAPAPGKRVLPAPLPAFEASDGLDQEEAVSVALFANPGLRAYRRERGTAEGMLVNARLFANAEIFLWARYIDGVTKSLETTGFHLHAFWTPPRWGERDSAIEGAEARIQEVEAEIAAREWDLAADVRAAHLALAAADVRLELVDATLSIKDRVRHALRDKWRAGGASRLEVNLAELEYARTLRQRTAASYERERLRQVFNALLGLPPSLAIPLQGGRESLEYAPYDLDADVLERVMLASRPHLAAARARYAQTEQALRLSFARRLPVIKFGPSVANDDVFSKEDGKALSNKVGFVLSFWPPIWNQNQGEIAAWHAAREQAHDSFRSLVHDGRAAVNEALRRLSAQAAQIRLFVASIEPVLAENQRLTEVGLVAGEFDVLGLLTTQNSVLEARIGFVEDRLAYRLAVVDLERALGVRVSRADEATDRSRR